MKEKLLSQLDGSQCGQINQRKIQVPNRVHSVVVLRSLSRMIPHQQGIERKSVRDVNPGSLREGFNSHCIDDDKSVSMKLLRTYESPSELLDPVHDHFLQ